MDMTMRMPSADEAIAGQVPAPVHFLRHRAARDGHVEKRQHLAGLLGPEQGSAPAENIWVTRTSHGKFAPRRDSLICPVDRYLFTIALADADVSFSDARGVVLDGAMAAGSVYIAGPAQEIRAAFAGPCDFLHLSVLKGFLEQQFALAGFGPPSRRRDLDRLVMHDPPIEQIGRFLAEGPAGWPSSYVETLGQLVVARLLRLLPRSASRTALPLWRLRKVKALIESDIAAPLRLGDLAAAAGLSRMHFAAQFRVATGHRPHEYVLTRRIEHAKDLIERHEMSLVQVALDAGFQSQAHFCTIFKRMTGVTPTGWRRQRRASALRSFEAGVGGATNGGTDRGPDRAENAPPIRTKPGRIPNHSAQHPGVHAA